MSQDKQVECPACSGWGWMVPGAKVGHWVGLMPWPARLKLEPCSLCDGQGTVDVALATDYERFYEEDENEYSD